MSSFKPIHRFFFYCYGLLIALGLLDLVLLQFGMSLGHLVYQVYPCTQNIADSLPCFFSYDLAGAMFLLFLPAPLYLYMFIRHLPGLVQLFIIDPFQQLVITILELYYGEPKE